MSPIAELLSIGSELLLGETVDTNAAFLGAELASLGLPLSRVQQLPDDRAVLAAAFREARDRAPVVLATGGLGPTHDDLTRESLADALGETLAEDAGLRRALEVRYRSFGPMPASNLRQALRIPSAEPLPNPIGSAPGWWVNRETAVTALMPGVPSEMRLMWAEQVRPRLAALGLARPLVWRTVKAFGIGESAAAERLAALLEPPPSGVEAGIYARDDGIHVRFSTRQDAPTILGPLVTDALRLLGADAYGTDADGLADAAMAALGRRDVRTLATWETGTDGALLAILAAAASWGGDRSPRFVGGLLDATGQQAAPLADALLRVSLGEPGRHGRSQVEVEVSGAVVLPSRTIRIHGSGPQRLRRAAFAALDVVRREA